ncbi:MAG: mechanosensitive ion channel family protein [Dehalococcoidia bacterium]
MFNLNFNLYDLIVAAVRVLIILIVAWGLLLVLRRVIRRIIMAKLPRVREQSDEELNQRAETLSGVLNRAVSFIVWVIAFMMVLGTIGVNITPILAALGVASLALGFAAQNIIRDYINGIFIIMEDWYRVGEVASVAGIGGLVDDFNLRRTVLRDLDGTMHMIPNSQIAVSSNMTREWARVNLDVAVGYGENLDRVFQVINEVCQSVQDDAELGGHLITTPAVVRVNELGDHGVIIKVMGDTQPAQQWEVMGELRKRLKVRFDEEGIEIPWPHTKVYFGNSSEGAGNSESSNRD